MVTASTRETLHYFQSQLKQLMQYEKYFFLKADYKIDYFYRMIGDIASTPKRCEAKRALIVS